MRTFFKLMAVAALAAPAGLRAQLTAEHAPLCRASMDGGNLLTVIEFADGSSVAAPWQVLASKPAALDDGARGVRMGARLERIVEVDPAGRRRSTPFPRPIDVTFEGHDRNELVSNAAQVWCMSVLRARAEAPDEAPEHTVKPVGWRATL